MNKLNTLMGKLALGTSSVLLAFASCGQPSLSVGVRAPTPAVEGSLPSITIHAESDFYEPLSPQGEWVVVGTYGRCWRPAHVERDWRPYCNGNWERTDAGWYWVSDEPWAWATYHYGRWDYAEDHGWYWMPQTQWAPAWVSWHEGGGYVGWAPLQPSVRITGSGFVGFNESRISPRAFVFIKQDRFLEPIRPASVEMNNTTILKKTTTIANTRIVNNTVINGGPAQAAIETASGRKLKEVPVGELRHKQESSVAASRTTTPNASEQKVSPATVKRSEPREEKTVSQPASRAEKSTVVPDLKPRDAELDKPRSALPSIETKSESKASLGTEPGRPREDRQPVEKSEKHVERQEKAGKPN
jgi:hypothetical protein